MNKKLLLGLSAIMLTATLFGCSQVHFGRDAVTIGTEKKAKPKVEHKKDQSTKKESAATSSSKKSVKKTTKKVEKTKDKKVKDKNKKKKSKSKTKRQLKLTGIKPKLKNASCSKSSGQTYRFYDGIHPLKTKKGDTYPQAFKQARFVLKKKPIKIGWSPLGKNKYQYNVVAIANDDFKSWHNTYLFCLKKNKPVILLDQSKKSGVVVVKQVNDATLIKGFKKAYQK